MGIIVWTKKVLGLQVTQDSMESVGLEEPVKAKAVLISDKLRKGGVQETGDIVGIFPLDHKFSPTELSLFDIVEISQSREDIYATPQVALKVIDVYNDGSLLAWYDPNDDKYKEMKRKPFKAFLRYDNASKTVINKIYDYPENFTTEVIITKVRIR